MMRFSINVNKKHAIIIIALFLIAGFGIAQTSNSNPRHDSNEVWVTGASNIMDQTLNDLLSFFWQRIQTSESSITSLGGRVGNLEDGKWTPINPPITGGTLCTEAPCTVSPLSYDIPVAIPPSAKEILVYVWIARGGGGGNQAGTPRHFNIYTKEGAIKYSNYFVMMNYPNSAYTFNSDNIWLPVTSDSKVYVELLPLGVDGNIQSSLQFIGYRN